VAYSCEFAKPTFIAARSNKSAARRNSRSRDTMVTQEQRLSINQVKQVLGSVLGDNRSI
jgi:hypothetical protein